jgi:hypothetical protein
MFIDQRFFHRPGEGVQILRALPAEDLFLEIERGATHFACRRIEKTDKGFSIMAKHRRYSIIKNRMDDDGGRSQY